LAALFLQERRPRSLRFHSGRPAQQVMGAAVPVAPTNRPNDPDEGRRHTDSEARFCPMRLVACLTMCLIPILANAAQAEDAQAPSDPQAFCVNRSADFYPYRGEPCKSGYQLGSGNCRKADGRIVAVSKEECAAPFGTVEIPIEGGRRPQTPQPTKWTAKRTSRCAQPMSAFGGKADIA